MQLVYLRQAASSKSNKIHEINNFLPDQTTSSENNFFLLFFLVFFKEPKRESVHPSARFFLVTTKEDQPKTHKRRAPRSIMAKSGRRRKKEESPGATSLKKGMFTAKESKAVLLAAEKAAKAMGLSDARELLEKKGKAKRAGATVWRQLSESEFPDRTPLSLYSHVKRKLHPGGYRGAWTESESARLRTLFESLGADWMSIAAELERTPENCRDRFRLVFGEPQYYDAKGGERAVRRLHRGKWTEEETKRLASAKVAGRSVLEVANAEKVNFVKLSKRVRTRSAQQCQRRWESLKREESLHKNVLQFPAHQLELCEKLAKATTENDIDWDTLFGQEAPKAKACWTRLKATTNDHNNADFPQVLESITNRLRNKVHDDMLLQWGDDDTSDIEEDQDDDDEIHHHHLDDDEEGEKN